MIGRPSASWNVEGMDWQEEPVERSLQAKLTLTCILQEKAIFSIDKKKRKDERTKKSVEVASFIKKIF